MAGLTDSSITYTGKDAQGFYSAAILTGETKSRVKVYPNVKNAIKISSLDVSTNLVQAADCSFSDAGTVTLDQKTLSVCDAKVNKEFCVTEFEANYLSEQLKAGANDGQVPSSFQEYLLAEMSKRVSRTLENVSWTGDASGSPSTFCDGYLTLFTAGADTVPVSGTTLSASNIIAELAKVYIAIPEAVRNSPDMKLWVSPAAASFYKLAQAAVATGSGSYFIGDRPLDYLGIEMIVCPGMPTNDIVAAETQNLWLATDLTSDYEDVQIIDMNKTTGAPNVRFVSRFKFGVNYGVGAEIVWYT